MLVLTVPYYKQNARSVSQKAVNARCHNACRSGIVIHADTAFLVEVDSAVGVRSGVCPAVAGRTAAVIPSILGKRGLAVVSRHPSWLDLPAADASRLTHSDTDSETRGKTEESSCLLRMLRRSKP